MPDTVPHLMPSVQASDPQKSTHFKGPEYYIPRFKKISSTTYTLILVPKRIVTQTWVPAASHDGFGSIPFGAIGETLPSGTNIIGFDDVVKECGAHTNIYFREWAFSLTKNQHPGWWRYNSMTHCEYLPFKILFPVIEGQLKKWGFGLSRVEIIKMILEGGENSPETQEEYITACHALGLNQQKQYMEQDLNKRKQYMEQRLRYEFHGATLDDRKYISTPRLYDSNRWQNITREFLPEPKPKAPPVSLKQRIAEAKQALGEAKKTSKKLLIGVLNKID